MRPSAGTTPGTSTGNKPFELKKAKQLVAEFEAFAQGIDPLERCLKAVKTGVFSHPDGRDEELGIAKINVEAAALLSHLCRICPSPLSVEVGFCVGTSATVMLGTRAALNTPFEHLIFDPYGLGGKGKLVEAYLECRFGKKFKRIRKPSEIGLGELLHDHKPGCAGLTYIDGGHHYENVMTDFVLADKLCCQGGTIVFDDAYFPAIETVLNYIRANRPDYALLHLPVSNTSVVKRIGPDKREWSAFKPFAVPQREDWTPAWH